MNNLATLTAKHVRMGIKRAYTFDQFCDELDCSREDFTRRLRQLWRNDVSFKEVISQIEANRKKPRKKAAPVAVPEATEAPEATDITIVTSEVAEATEVTPASKATAATHACEIATSTPATSQLEELLKAEAELSDQVVALEEEHKSLKQSHRECLAEMRAERDEVEALRTKFEAVCRAYEATLNRADDLAERMTSVTKQRRILISELEETRRQIEAAKVVEIYVYADGGIEVSNGATISDEGIDEDVKRLVDHAECQDLRLREVRTLAKLLKFATASKLRLSLVCENSALEEAFVAMMREAPAAEILAPLSRATA